MTLKQRLVRTLILASLGLLLGAGIAGLSILSGKDGEESGSSLIATSIGGPFTLVNQEGKIVTDKDFATRYKIIYFGFASCPAICPTELQKIAEAYKSLPLALQQKIQPLFITVDPERDTPAVLKSYTALFLPQMVGLTGSVAQIDAVKDSYKIYAAKVPEGGGYTMDHSSFIYLETPQGQVVAMFKTSDTSAVMAKKIKDLLMVQ